jgi:hypothetical protein
MSEMKKEIREDSLFLGIYFGMTNKDFFTHCWELNKKGILENGVNNTTVRYKLRDFHPKLAMDFYPAFYEQKIYKMPLFFYFDDYSLWNTDLGPDSLQFYGEKVIHEWYGDDFILMVKEEGNLRDTLKVDVDSNRRVLIKKAKDNKLGIDITDLSLDKQAREAISKSNQK